MVESMSATVECWRNSENNTFCIKVTRIDTGENVPLQPGMFVLRFMLGSSSNIQRCLIRHTSSGRETYIQGGENLQAFVLDCVLEQVMGTDLTTIVQKNPNQNEEDERGEDGRLPSNRGDL